MNDVEEKTIQLVNAIQKSKEFLEYQALYEQMKENVTLLERFDEFRKKRFLVQSNLNERKGLLEEYKDILSEPLTKAFFLAEQRYCTTIRTVNHEINEGFSFDVDFLKF
ncbi:MAG: YlbF family regulator [Acetivibrio sp.]